MFESSFIVPANQAKVLSTGSSYKYLVANAFEARVLSFAYDFDLKIGGLALTDFRERALELEYDDEVGKLYLSSLYYPIDIASLLFRMADAGSKSCKLSIVNLQSCFEDDSITRLLGIVFNKTLQDLKGTVSNPLVLEPVPEVVLTVKFEDLLEQPELPRISELRFSEYGRAKICGLDLDTGIVTALDVRD